MEFPEAFTVKVTKITEKETCNVRYDCSERAVYRMRVQYKKDHNNTPASIGQTTFRACKTHLIHVLNYGHNEANKF